MSVVLRSGRNPILAFAISGGRRQARCGLRKYYQPSLRLGRCFSEAPARSSLVKGPNTMSLGDISRHGIGDGCITLSVGGTRFTTLRSTVGECPVLADHIVRAELNKDVMLDGAIFIDRDPKHFGFILQYLRNKADGIGVSSNSNRSLKKRISAAKVSLVLPKDHIVLQELYAEATYSRLDELAGTLCNTSFVVQAMGIFVRSNPFTEASKLFARLRAALLAFGTVGTVTVGVKQDIDWLLKPLGLMKREKLEPT